MKRKWAFALLAVTALILLSLLTFMISHILALSEILGKIHPALGLVSNCLLLGLLALCLFWLIGAHVFRQKPLTMPSNPSAAQKELYLAKLSKRLESNKYIIAAGLPASSVDRVPELTAYLDGLAVQEIKLVGKRVFVATAISQNGRLDSLIVFFQVASLVWKISRIYNQSPHPMELWKIYTNVLTVSLVSYGLDEADLANQIGSIISPIIPHAVFDKVPFVATIAKTFSHSIFTGAANASLACRVGVVTRNYIGLKTCPDSSVKQRPSLEALQILNEIVAESLPKVLGALGGSIKSISARGMRKASGAVADTATGFAGGLGNACQAVGRKSSDAYNSTKHGARKVAGAVRSVYDAVGDKAGDVFEATAGGVKKVSSTAAGVAGKAVAGLKKPVRRISSFLFRNSE
ncbi:MAG TPA: hypothetical protein PK250_10470 [Syntrophobacter fumaroxidans]|nr:hypothetical protein [Syntrophobacter fumaroxidans]